jgi:dihydrofolate synthase/folylpolyglutamate synthase
MNFLSFTLDDWLYYLENAHQKEIQLGLMRISTVARHLGLLDCDAQIITVAGTNGKGSTVATLEAIYIAAGYNVASYTSPHLMVFNERIRVNQQPITDENLCAAFIAIENARDGVHLTYFEMATLAALWHFKQCMLDVIILEVGIGGRLDATNIIDADIAIITTVDLDHQDYLGHTKDAIGYEKAGILRANKPFIYADNHPPTSVLEKAQLLNTDIYCLGSNYFFNATNDSFQLDMPTGVVIELPLPRINLKAAAAAIMACACLQATLPVTLIQLAEAMRTVQLFGRQQVVESSITTIFDVAHNPQAVTLLADFIHRYQPKGKVHAVFSGLKDKDLCGLIKPMQPYVDVWYPAVLSGKRAASAELLESVFATQHCPMASCFNDPVSAYHAAVRDAQQGDLIVVYGSFLTVSAIMEILNRMELEELQ